MKKILSKNREALHNYNILEQYEAGIVLNGSEVKSAKLGHVQMKGCYASIKNGELWLIGLHISLYKPGKEFELTRTRKLLVNKEEFAHLFTKSQEKGLTIIPTQVYLKKSLVKIEIAVAKGKKEYDKREINKKRDIERELKRKFKNIKI